MLYPMQAYLLYIVIVCNLDTLKAEIIMAKHNRHRAVAKNSHVTNNILKTNVASTLTERQIWDCPQLLLTRKIACPEHLLVPQNTPRESRNLQGNGILPLTGRKVCDCLQQQPKPKNYSSDHLLLQCDGLSDTEILPTRVKMSCAEHLIPPCNTPIEKVSASDVLYAPTSSPIYINIIENSAICCCNCSLYDERDERPLVPWLRDGDPAASEAQSANTYDMIAPSTMSSRINNNVQSLPIKTVSKQKQSPIANCVSKTKQDLPRQTQLKQRNKPQSKQLDVKNSVDAIIAKKITRKLNFPPHVSVFKNLISLNVEDHQSPTKNNAKSTSKNSSGTLSKNPTKKP